MNNTEKFIKNIYKTINISDPAHLSIEHIASKFSLSVHYWPYSSEMTEHKGKYMIFINENLNSQQQWQDFGHEIKHYFRDNENQNILYESFVDYCETKADYFSYHFCVPTFMLMNLKGVDVYDVMRLFNVEFDFALRRLEMYKSKMIAKRNVYILRKEKIK